MVYIVHNVVVFQDMMGGAATRYNTETGKYTCKIPGHYSFFADYMYSFSQSETSCKIRKNDDDLLTTVNVKLCSCEYKC